MRASFTALRTLLLLFCACALASWLTSAQAAAGAPPLDPAHDTSATLRYYVLRSHCVVVDLDLVLAQRVGYAGSIIFDNTTAHGVLWRGDIARNTSSAGQTAARRFRDRDALRSGASLDYGAGTVSYCPAPLPTAGAAAADDTSIADAVRLRFVPMPVTDAHPIASLALVFLTVPLTFEPVSRATVLLDGWELTGGHARGAWNTEGHVAPFSAKVKAFHALPIRLAPRAELLPHWRPQGSQSPVRYIVAPPLPSPIANATETRANAPLAPDPTTAAPAAAEEVQEPTMDALESIVLYPLADEPQPPRCVLYAVAAGDAGAEGGGADDEAGDADEAALMEQIAAWPFEFPPTSQIRFQLNQTEEEVLEALTRVAQLDAVGPAQEHLVNATSRRAASSVCAFVYHARQKGSAGYSALGSVRVEWAPPPRVEVTVADLLVVPRREEVGSLRVAATALDPAAVPSLSRLRQLCVEEPRVEGGFRLSVSVFPHCQECDADTTTTCEMTVPYSYVPGTNETTLPAGEHDLSPGQGNGTATLLPALVVTSGTLSFYAVSTIHSLGQDYVSGRATSTVRTVNLNLFERLYDAVGTPVYAVHANATSAVPLVIDIASKLPMALRPFVDHVDVDGASIDRLSGELYSRATPATVSEARRGLLWQRLHAGVYAHLDGSPSPLPLSNARARPRLTLRGRPLLRYLPPSSWWPSSCGAADAVGAAVEDHVSVRVSVLDVFTVRLTLNFTVAAMLCRALSTPLPDTWWQGALRLDLNSTLPAVITTHRIVHRSTVNPLLLPLPKDGVGAGTPVPPPQTTRTIRLVSVPSAGTVSRLPACANASRQSQWLLGHCGTRRGGGGGRPRPTLDSAGGCVCCFEDCAALVGDTLHAGALLEASGVAVTAPFWVSYTPATSNPDGCGGEAPAAEEAVDEVRIHYVEWPLRQPVQLYEVVLHLREWPDTAVRPSLLLPLAGKETPNRGGAADATTAAAAHRRTSEKRYYVLRMSARPDVATALLAPATATAAPFSVPSTFAFQWRVFECVPARGDGDTAAWWRLSFTPSARAKARESRHGVFGYWPSLTRGCLIVETVGEEPLPLLTVHAVLLPAPETVTAAPPGGGSCAALRFATVPFQPYVFTGSAAPSVFWDLWVAAGDRLWPLRKGSVSHFAKITVPPTWGLLPSRQSAPPFAFTLRFSASGDDETGEDAVEVRLSRVPSRGCVAQPPGYTCLQQGQRAVVRPCKRDAQPTKAMAATDGLRHGCVELSYVVPRYSADDDDVAGEWRDVVAVTAVTAEGDAIGGVVTVVLEGAGSWLSAHLPEAALCTVGLVVVVAMLPRRLLRRACRYQRRVGKNAGTVNVPKGS